MTALSKVRISPRQYVRAKPTDAELIARFWRRMATVELPRPDGPPFPAPPHEVNRANTAILAAEMRELRADRLRSEEADDALRPLNLAHLDRLRAAVLSSMTDQVGAMGDPAAWLTAFMLALDLADLKVDAALAHLAIKEAIARAERRGHVAGRAEKFAPISAALWAARRRLRRKRRLVRQ